MKRAHFFYALLSASLLWLCPAESHAHSSNDLKVGANTSGQLYLTNPEKILSVYHLVYRTGVPVLYGYNGQYTLDHLSSSRPTFPDEYFSIRALAATPEVAGTDPIDPNHADLGAFLTTRIVSVTGPAGGEFWYWDFDVQTGQPVRKFTAGAATGNFSFNLSDEYFMGPNEDPGAHYDRRGWSATTLGTYVVGIQFVDISTYEPGGGPRHTPSQVYYLTFQAVPEPGVGLLLMGGGGWMLMRRRRRVA